MSRPSLIQGGWRFWEHVMVRSAGFPVHSVAAFADDQLAETADGVDDTDPSSRTAYEHRWREYDTVRQAALNGVLGRPDFTLALTWQNSRLIQTAIGPLLDQIARGEPRSRKRRLREQVVAAYWQRYCTKSESIGFFGPTAWGTLDPAAPASAAVPGPTLVARPTAFLESWPVDRLARRLLANTDLRPWLAPRRAPHISVGDGQLWLPDGAAQDLDPLTEAVLTSVDGDTPARTLARRLVARFPEVTDQDVYGVLTDLRRRGWLIWRAELGTGLRSEVELRALLDRIGQPDREPAVAALDKIDHALCAIGQASLDAERLPPALAQLESTVAAITGDSTTTRSDGQAYAGRTVAYLECRRDVAVRLGGDVIAALAPVTLVLDSIRWLLHHVGAAVTASLTQAYRHLVASGVTEPTAVMLWTSETKLLGGGIHDIVASVLAEAQRRWRTVLAIPDGSARATFRLADLRAPVAEAFAVPAAGWTDARWCSPDVMIAAADEQAFRCGEFHLVLGEVHGAANTFDYQSMVGLHERPQELVDRVDADHPGPRLIVALPRESRPRLTVRSHPAFVRDIDHHLVLMPHIPIPTRGQVVLGADVPVVLTDNGPQLVMGNGDRFPAIDMFAHALRGEVAQAFDLYPAGHRPRVVVDRLTIARERWSLPAAEMVFADAPDEAARFLACRRFAGRRALPRYLFVKSPLETKPFYVDLASPVYVELLVSAVRKLRGDQPDAALSVTEMLPSIDRTWLPDASGNRYVAEFRFVACDTRSMAEGIGWKR